MTDDELFDEFIRVENTPDGVCIQVCTISWNGHTPISTWVLGRSLPKDTPKDEVRSAARSLLQDQRFFGRCTECHELNALGHMIDDDWCHGCAQRGGVVF